MIRKGRPPTTNLYKDERLALKALREEKNVIILPADKGNATLVMDAAEYKKKKRNCWKTQVYKNLKKDPRLAT